MKGPLGYIVGIRTLCPGCTDKARKGAVPQKIGAACIRAADEWWNPYLAFSQRLQCAGCGKLLAEKRLGSAAQYNDYGDGRDEECDHNDPHTDYNTGSVTCDDCGEEVDTVDICYHDQQPPYSAGSRIIRWYCSSCDTEVPDTGQMAAGLA